MKIFFKPLFAFMALVLITINTKAQFTITGSCVSSGNNNTITVGPGAGGGNIYPVGTSGSCEIVTVSGPLVNQYTLWKLVNGSWTAASSPNVSVNSFTGLAPGTYQVTGQFPQQVSSACPGGYIKIDNYIGQWIGYGGNYGATQTSNTVSIGIPSLSDVQASFIGDGGTCGASLYNITNANGSNTSKHVRLSTAGTNPYSAYAVFINEGCSPNRWVPQQEGPGAYAAGWVNGPPPSVLDISYDWQTGTGGGFNNYCQYTIQYVVSNGGCGTGWYEKDYVFTIEPSTSPCELTDPDASLISLTPNPASNNFRLNNVLFTPGAEYHLSLTDMSGRLVKEYTNVAQSGQNFDISEVGVGLYVAALWNGNERIFTTKLSVSR